MEKAIFKQPVLREEIIKLCIIMIAIFIPYLTLLFLGLYGDSLFELFTIFYLTYWLVTLYFGIRNLEWYFIYNNRIEAKCLFGIKNTVYFENVSFVEEIDISLAAHGMIKKFYIFNDGRKNNNSFLGLNSCYNNKKFNLRIYKTQRLEDFVNDNEFSMHMR